MAMSTQWETKFSQLNYDDNNQLGGTAKVQLIIINRVQIALIECYGTVKYQISNIFKVMIH